MSMNRHARLTLCAERIQALINSKVASPSLEELRAVIADVMAPHNAIFNSPPVEAEPVKVQCGSAQEEQRFGAVPALFDGPGDYVSKPLSLEDFAVAHMADKGFVYKGWRNDICTDALYLTFNHRNIGRTVVVAVSGLEQLQNSTPHLMHALVEARCADAISEAVAIELARKVAS